MPAKRGASAPTYSFYSVENRSKSRQPFPLVPGLIRPRSGSRWNGEPVETTKLNPSCPRLCENCGFESQRGSFRKNYASVVLAHLLSKNRAARCSCDTLLHRCNYGDNDFAGTPIISRRG